MVAHTTILDRRETHANRILRQMEAAAAQAWRESTTASAYAQCPGYLHLHNGIDGAVDCYWCPTCSADALS